MNAKKKKKKKIELLDPTLKSMLQYMKKSYFEKNPENRYEIHMGENKLHVDTVSKVVSLVSWGMAHLMFFYFKIILSSDTKSEIDKLAFFFLILPSDVYVLQMTLS